MRQVFLCDAVRTPIGRYGGALAQVRADDLAAIPIRELMQRNPGVDWSAMDDVILGCANQAGEDNRNVARMALLLAGLPESVPGTTMNRLCGSGMDAVGTAARAIACGEAEFIIAGGVESMSRAPFVMGKAESAFQRSAEIFDTTIGWRFVNPADARDVRHGLHAGDRRECGARLLSGTCRAGRVCVAQPDACSPCNGVRILRRRDRAGGDARQKGRKQLCRRTSIRGRIRRSKNWPLSSRCFRGAP